MKAPRGISWLRLLAILLVLGASGGLRAQDGAAGQGAFEDGLKAAEEKRLDDAITAFRECLRLIPRSANCAYNLARAYSRKADVPAAAEWLSHATDWGFEDVEFLLADEDLTNVRSHSAYRQAVEDIQNRFPSEEPRPYVEPERPDRGVELVAMLRTDLGSGAGILISREGDRLYVATANHVVRQGAEEAKTIEVQVEALAPRWHRAVLLPAVADAELDLAFLAVDGTALDFCALPLAVAGDISRLRRGDAVYPVGYPSGILWAMPLTPDHAARVMPGQISFESQFVRVGFSGGALLNQRGEIVGMITADEPPLGRAVPLPLILDAARAAGYPVQLAAAGGQRASTPLHAAAAAGNAAAIRRLLENCADPNALDAAGRTSLHEAAAHGSAEAVRMLVAGGARLHAWALMSAKDSPPEFGVPLHLAAANGHIDAVKALLTGGDVDVKTLGRNQEEQIVMSRTPLHLTAEHDRGAVAEVLIAAGAALEAFSMDGRTPLGAAAAHGAVGAARVLIQRGAAVWPHSQFVFPLYVAAAEGKVEILKLLVEHGADVNHNDWAMYLSTPLQAAAARSQLEAAAFLISQGAEINARGYKGGTALHSAAEKGSGPMVEFLLANGAEKNAQNELHTTPVRLASERTDVGSLQVLLKAGAEIDVELLRRIIDRGDANAARALIEGGLDPSLRSVTGEQPLRMAAAARMHDVVAMLLKAGAPVDDRSDGKTALDIAARNGDVRTLDLLIAAGATINAPDQRESALQTAVSHSRTAAVERLLKAGADPNSASLSGPADILTLLLAAGVDPNGQDARGWSPLHHAAASRDVERVRLLLSHGASVDAADSCGRTALSMALEYAHEEPLAIVEALVAAGADVNASCGGTTTLDLAKSRRYQKVQRLLLAKGAKAASP